MRLALALGYRSRREMLRGMTAEDVTEWMEFFKLEPFGSRHEDLRFALLGEGLSIAMRNPLEHEVFTPRYQAAPQSAPQTAAPLSQNEALAAHNAFIGKLVAMGATVVPRKE